MAGLSEKLVWCVASRKKIAAVFALILLRLVLRTKPCSRAISFSQARRNDLHPVTRGIVSYSYKL